MDMTSLLMLALDHRGSFAQIAQTKDVPSLINIKYIIIASLYDQFSGLLIDQDYGLPAYQRWCQEKQITNPKPFITCIEATGYENQDEEKVTTLQYTVAELKAIGAAGIKLLLFFNPDGTSPKKQIATALTVAADCAAEQLLFFLEIVTYPLPNHLYEKADAICRSVQQLITAGVIPSVWKLEYPGTAEACETVNKIVGAVPWILLTRGVTFETFRDDLTIAAAHGATGFLAGRAIWQEFPNLTGDKKDHFFSQTIPQRFAEICSIVTEKTRTYSSPIEGSK